MLTCETKAKNIPYSHDESERDLDRLEEDFSLLLLGRSFSRDRIACQEQVTDFVAPARHRPERPQIDPVVAREADLLGSLALCSGERRLSCLDRSSGKLAGHLIERIPVLADERDQPVVCDRARTRKSVGANDLVAQLAPVGEPDEILVEVDVPPGQGARAQTTPALHVAVLLKPWVSDVSVGVN